MPGAADVKVSELAALEGVTVARTEVEYPDWHINTALGAKLMLRVS